MIRIQTLRQRLRLLALCGFIVAWPFETQRQTPVHSTGEDPLVIIARALTPEHQVYSAISVVNSRLGDLANTQAQFAVIGSNRTIYG